LFCFVIWKEKKCLVSDLKKEINESFSATISHHLYS